MHIRLIILVLLTAAALGGVHYALTHLAKAEPLLCIHYQATTGMLPRGVCRELRAMADEAQQ